MLNRVAWARRWSDRQVSDDYARAARKTAAEGIGKRSRAEQGNALRTLAWNARWRGDFDEALSNCLSAETFLPESAFAEVRAGIYSTLGVVHFSRNRLDLANCAVDRGYWLLRDMPELDASEAMTDLLLTRAAIQRHSGEKARASITLGRAREISTGEQKSSVGYCTALWLVADGEIESARQLVSETLEEAISTGNRLVMPYLHAIIGSCDAKLGRGDSAVENLELGLSIATADNDTRARCYLLREFAKVDAECKNENEAFSKLREAAEMARAMGFAFEQKRIALDTAALLEKAGKYKQAIDQHKLAWRLQSATRVR